MRKNMHSSKLLFLTIIAFASACASSRTIHNAPTPNQPSNKPINQDSEQMVKSAQPPANDHSSTPPTGLNTEELRTSSLKILQESLNSQDLEIHAEALVALGVSALPDSQQKLCKALEAEEGVIRHAAAQGLFYLRSTQVSETLVRAFQKEKGWAIKKELAKTAVVSNAKELIPELKKALADRNKELQVAVAFALHDLGDPSGAKALQNLGSPKRKEVLREGVDRWSRKVLTGKKEGDYELAAKTLARVGKKEDLIILKPYLADLNPTVKLWAAAAILKQINQPTTEL
jgi:HEAT repeat protein